MTELPKISSEELYKSLYEKSLAETNKYREQVTSLEILATKIRDQRDSLAKRITDLEQEISSKEEQLRGYRGEGEVLEPDEIVE